MEKVLVISTGGTILSADRGDGVLPDAGAARSVLSKAEEILNAKSCRCEICQMFGCAGVDSSDVSPAEWLALSKKINEEAERGVKKFLVVHGTDTMAYTAAWLSLTAPAGVSVVLTGSQRTPDAPDFDGEENLRGAAKSLSSGKSGVFLHFAGKDYAGAFVHKENSSALAAYVATGRGTLPRAWTNTALGVVDWCEAAARMELIQLHPAALPLFSPRKIIILEGYGAGNMPRRVRAALCEAFAPCAEKPAIIAASSCAQGKKSPSFYGGVGIAGLAKENFSVFNQGSYSLEFLIALSYFSLSADAEEPEKILSLYLEKY